MKNRNEGPVSHIIETDEQRRIRGRFYTPQIFADFGLEMLDRALGEGWEDRYVVWDPCCGEKALTRSRKFRELYCGTIDEDELEHSVQYNPEATSYVFDFLNDPLENLPPGLLEAFEQDRPLVVIMNPPYGTAGKSDGGVGYMGIKKGSAKTMMNKRMKQDKVGPCSQNLYAQFLYRILLIKEKYNLSDISIGLFCKPGYLTGPTYKGFRKRFLESFQYLGGILFNAGYFSGVKATWGIDFTVWTTGETVDKNNFPHMLVEVFDGTITPVGEKVLYNLDRETTASDWTKEPINGIETYDCPQMTSGLKIKQEGKTMFGRMADGALGSFSKNSNNTSKNSQGTGLFTSGYSSATNFPVMPSNFERCTALFAARSLVKGNWINDKDEYMKPNDCRHGKTKRGRMANGALGSFCKDKNNISGNSQGTALFTSGYASGNDFPVMPSNFERCTALFAARRLVQSNWMNVEDEYMKPNDCRHGKTKHGRTADGVLGSFYKHANNIMKNSNGTALFTSGFASGHDIPVIPSNFERCTALFAARRLVQSNWTNDNGEYMKPYDFDAEYEEFVADSVVYSLFDSKSQQTSLKNITYKGKQWDIPNQWFWLPKEVIAIK